MSFRGPEETVVTQPNRLRSRRPLTPRGDFPGHEDPSSRAPSTKARGNSSDERPLSPPLPQRSDDVCVAVTGGAGQIAYALLPLLIHGRVFGDGRRVRLRLLDIEPCAEALEGVAMEIRDCFSPLVRAPAGGGGRIARRWTISLLAFFFFFCYRA